MLCSKENAKDTCLNIWVEADSQGNGPEVEYVKLIFREIQERILLH